MKILSGLSLQSQNFVGVSCAGDHSTFGADVRDMAGRQPIGESNAQQYGAIAADIADKIDRNLFERYGDVQAFGVNSVVRDRDDWGKVGEENSIARAMNRYVQLYGVYTLTMLLDTDGNVVAVELARQQRQTNSHRRSLRTQLRQRALVQGRDCRQVL